MLRNRALWESVRPADYSYDLERRCFCTEEGRGPARVKVTGGQVVERSYVATGKAVPEDMQSLFPPVDGLFDVLMDALDRHAFRIDVSWDSDTGVPMEFWIDYDHNTADEELGYAVRAGPGSGP